MADIIDSEIQNVLDAFLVFDKWKETELQGINQLIPSLSNDIKGIVAKEEDKIKSKKERFNIFSCLTRHHLEELHSKFICYLLNPTESHDCGQLFLRTFIEILLESEHFVNVSLSGILDDSEINSAVVIREHSTQYGRIDIFVETKSFVIAIENKIHAGEQTRQIERYAKYCMSKKKEYFVLYLTLSGHESFEHNYQKYFLVSYKEHILKWLDKCISQTEELNYTTVYPGLNYYKQLLNKLLNITSSTILMEIQDLLLKKENRQLLKYLEQLQEAIPVVHSKLRIDFFTAIQKKLTSLGYTTTAHKNRRPAFKKINVSEIYDDLYSGIAIIDSRLSFPLNEKHELRFLIEHNGQDLYFGLFPVGRDNQHLQSSVKYKNIFTDIAIQFENYHQQLEAEDDGYICWKYYEIKGKTFDDYSLDFDLAENLEKISSQFIESVQEYLNVWKKIRGKLSKVK